MTWQKTARIFFSALALSQTFLTIASATPILNVDSDSGRLLGASNININGAKFNLQFLDGSCVSLFDGCDEKKDFPLSFDDAYLAASILDREILQDSLLGRFDTIPRLTNGCHFIREGSTSSCQIFIPIEPHPSNPRAVRVTGLNNSPSENFDSPPYFTGFFGTDSMTNGFFRATFAVFSPSISVPEPSSMSLIIFGLLGLLAANRSKS